MCHLPKLAQRAVHWVAGESNSNKRQWVIHCLWKLRSRLPSRLHPTLAENPKCLPSVQQRVGLCQNRTHSRRLRSTILIYKKILWRIKQGRSGQIYIDIYMADWLAGSVSVYRFPPANDTNQEGIVPYFVRSTSHFVYWNNAGCPLSWSFRSCTIVLGVSHPTARTLIHGFRRIRIGDTR